MGGNVISSSSHTITNSFYPLQEKRKNPDFIFLNVGYIGDLLFPSLGYFSVFYLILITHIHMEG